MWVLSSRRPWETPNASGVISSEIDATCFKLAWLKELPAWRREQQRLKGERTAQERRRQRDGDLRRQREEQGHALQTRKEMWAQVKAKADADAEETRQAARYHKRLQASVDRLQRREAWQAKRDPAFEELMNDLRNTPARVERWLRDHKWIA